MRFNLTSLWLINSGYMSPEYAMDGLFSAKSDVFSFGVLVLEIVTGKKNRGFYYANNELNLLGHVRTILPRTSVFLFFFLPLKSRSTICTHQVERLELQAWRLWKEGKGIELLDPSAGESYSPPEVLRCIQVGLLCVQEHAEDRPVMSNAVLMLGSETATMPHPKNPGFCLGRNIETDSSSSKQDESCTMNQVTVTMLHGR